MKKLNLITLVLLTGLTILSCSSNDDKNETKDKQELLIGKWKKIKLATICAPDNEISEEYSVCQQKGTTTFYANGTYLDIPYIEYNNECISDGETSGTWQIVNNQLQIKRDGNPNAINNTLFEVSENSLKIGGEDEPCDGEDKPSIEYLEYIKIE